MLGITYLRTISFVRQVAILILQELLALEVLVNTILVMLTLPNMPHNQMLEVTLLAYKKPLIHNLLLLLWMLKIGHHIKVVFSRIVVLNLIMLLLLLVMKPMVHG